MPTPSPAYEVAWRLDEAGVSDSYAWSELTSRSRLEAMRDELRSLTPGLHLSPFELEGLQGSKSLVPNDAPPQPRPFLQPRGGWEHVSLRDDRLAFVGAGAGSLILASYLSYRGAKPENMTFTDPRDHFGGAWTEPSTQVGGFNNPAALEFSPRHRLALADRSGARMYDFLAGIASRHLRDATYIQGTVVNLAKSKKDKTWLVTDTHQQTHEADYVVLASGTPHPRPIHGKRVASNLDTVSAHIPSDLLIIERKQRELTREELESDRLKILWGLGNSTGTMLRQIHTHEKATGKQINYLILTDLPKKAIQKPNKTVKPGVQPIFRNVKTGYLTGYSGDIADDKYNFTEARARGNIITDCRKVNYDARRHKLVIETADRTLAVDQPHIFALLGFERDEVLLKQVGALGRRLFAGKHIDDSIRPCDGAVHTSQDGFVSNLFAVGAFAATRRNPNAAVMPGIFAQVPATTLTMAIRSGAR